MSKVKANKIGTEAVQIFPQATWDLMESVKYEYEGITYSHGGWVEFEDTPKVPPTAKAKDTPKVPPTAKAKDTPKVPPTAKAKDTPKVPPTAKAKDTPKVPPTAKVDEAVLVKAIGDCTAEDLINYVVAKKLQIKSFRLMPLNQLFDEILKLSK
jgi:DNA uptake protein ComE-like DNA-binding protein